MPSHTSSTLQPLDVAVFKTVKLNYEIMIRAFLQEKTHRQGGCASLTKFELVQIFHASWRKAIIGQTPEENNWLARLGFNETGICPLNMNWVDDNMDKMLFSTPFSTDEMNREITEVAIEHNVTGRQEATDIFVAKRLRTATTNQGDLVKTFLEKTGSNITVEEFGAMVNRVSTSQYSNQSTDVILVECWWKGTIDELKTFRANNNQPTTKKRKRNTVIAWGGYDFRTPGPNVSRMNQCYDNIE